MSWSKKTDRSSMYGQSQYDSLNNSFNSRLNHSDDLGYHSINNSGQPQSPLLSASMTTLRMHPRQSATLSEPEMLVEENFRLRQTILDLKLRTNSKIVELESQVNYLNDIIRKLCVKSDFVEQENSDLKSQLSRFHMNTSYNNS